MTKINVDPKVVARYKDLISQLPYRVKAIEQTGNLLKLMQETARISNVINKFGKNNTNEEYNQLIALMSKMNELQIQIHNEVMKCRSSHKEFVTELAKLESNLENAARLQSSAGKA